MSAEDFSRKSVFTNLISVLVGLILFCVCLNLFQFHELQTSSAPDLVYCPLQKTWVARYEPKPAKKYNPFGEICAADKRKTDLQNELALKLARPLTEKIVFDYLARGNNALAKFNELPDAPQNEFIVQTKLKTAVKNGSYDFIKSRSFNLILPQTPRPPTFAAKVFFEIKNVRALQQISRSINPRSPPFLS